MPNTAPTLPDWSVLTATPQQQEELLAAARAHAVLYPHDLPSGLVGDNADRAGHLLQLVLNGQASDLEATHAVHFEPLDSELDSAQVSAVAAALATPDVAIIAGPPGTGKTRTLIELVRQAHQRGLRVAVTSPSLASIDRILRLLATHAELLPLRILGHDEPPESLSDTSARFTHDGHRQNIRQTALTKTQHEIANLSQQLDQLARTAQLLAQLQALATQRDQARATLQACNDQLSQVEPSVRAAVANPELASAPLAAALAESAQRLRTEQERIGAERDSLLAQQAQLQQSIAALDAELQSLAETRPEKRWWKADFWVSGQSSKIQSQREGLSQQRAELQNQLHALSDSLARCQHQLDAAQAADAQRREQAIAAEIERLRGELTATLAAETTKLQALEQQWHDTVGQIDWPTLRPTTDSSEELARVAAQCQQLLTSTQQLLESSRAFADELTHSPEAILGSTLALANVIVGPLGLFQRDDLAHVAALPFDYILVDDAQHLSEIDFLTIAPFGRKWVLVGDTSYELTAAGYASDRHASDRHASGTHARTPRAGGRGYHAPALPVPGFFGRLWAGLHLDVWARAGEQFCCRLRHVPEALEPYVECEPLADHPGVELRICTPPDAGPFLAEMRFPPGMSISQAKRLIFAELGELPIQSRGRSGRWHEDGDRISFYLEEGTPPPHLLVSVPLDEGIRESLVDFTAADHTGDATSACSTCRLDFDMKAGWTREKAQEWMLQHVINNDTGRSARLAVQYRQPSPLARFVGELFPHAGCRLPAVEATTVKTSGIVEFVPVPPLPEPRREPGRPNATSAAARRLPPGMRSGAGLEIDLADPRQREHLPAEWRDCLPNQGLVNLAEAQLIVRLIEAQPQPLCVVALYPEQAELIRRLLAKSRAANRHVAVEEPRTLRAWEHEIVIVSLTRSLAHRAVSLGDDPSTVLAAFSRARCRLTIVGDPGTLVRRSQYEGRVDHLDERASAIERTWTARLVQYLNGHSHRNVRFRLTEGPRL